MFVALGLAPVNIRGHKCFAAINVRGHACSLQAFHAHEFPISAEFSFQEAVFEERSDRGRHLFEQNWQVLEVLNEIAEGVFFAQSWNVHENVSEARVVEVETLLRYRLEASWVYERCVSRSKELIVELSECRWFFNFLYIWGRLFRSLIFIKTYSRAYILWYAMFNSSYITPPGAIIVFSIKCILVGT